MLGVMSPNIALPSPVSDLSPREQAEFLAPTLAALADVNRLTIALALSEKSMTNRQLHEATGLSPALVSHHLVALRRAGVVDTVARGRASVNSICCEQLADPVRWLAHLATLTPEGQKACCTDTTDDNGDHGDDAGRADPVNPVEQGQ
jgi:DNA-binding transcriptional ArsR family regulator